jgi:hypothetical protein
MGMDPRGCDRIHDRSLTPGGVRWFDIKRPVDQGSCEVERKAIRTVGPNIIWANVR